MFEENNDFDQLFQVSCCKNSRNFNPGDFY